METLQRFNRTYIGDSVISLIEIDFISATCTIFLDRAALLREGSSPSIFDPEEHYEPALLRFEEVRSISFLEDKFYLNGTIVDFEAIQSEDGIVEFHFRLTGGWDNATFMRTLSIEAKSFTMGPQRHPKSSA